MTGIGRADNGNIRGNTPEAPQNRRNFSVSVRNTLNNVGDIASGISHAMAEDGIRPTLDAIMAFAAQKAQEAVGNAVDAVGGQLANWTDKAETLATGLNKHERVFKDLLEGKFFDENGEISEEKLSPNIAIALDEMNSDHVEMSLVKVLKSLNSFALDHGAISGLTSELSRLTGDEKVTSEDWKALSESKCAAVRACVAVSSQESGTDVPKEIIDDMFANIRNEDQDSPMHHALASIDDERYIFAIAPDFKDALEFNGGSDDENEKMKVLMECTFQNAKNAGTFMDTLAEAKNLGPIAKEFKPAFIGYILESDDLAKDIGKLSGTTDPDIKDIHDVVQGKLTEKRLRDEAS